MKPTIKAVAVAVAIIIIAGCASQRRTQYLEAHPNIDPAFAQAIASGSIMRGMNKAQVAAAWGNPCRYCYGTRHGSWGDVWEYNPFGATTYGIGAGKYVYFDRYGHVEGWDGP